MDENDNGINRRESLRNGIYFIEGDKGITVYYQERGTKEYAEYHDWYKDWSEAKEALLRFIPYDGGWITRSSSPEELPLYIHRVDSGQSGIHCVKSDVGYRVYKRDKNGYEQRLVPVVWYEDLREAEIALQNLLRRWRQK